MKYPALQDHQSVTKTYHSGNQMDADLKKLFDTFALKSATACVFQNNICILILILKKIFLTMTTSNANLYRSRNNTIYFSFWSRILTFF